MRIISTVNKRMQFGSLLWLNDVLQVQKQKQYATVWFISSENSNMRCKVAFLCKCLRQVLQQCGLCQE